MNRVSQSVNKKCVSSGKQKKAELKDDDVVVQECLAYGRIQVKTSAAGTSHAEIEMPSVYEAIWLINKYICV